MTGPPARPPAQRHRRSLTHVGGEVETSGNRPTATALAHALDVAPAGDAAAADEPERAHVHGFHTYPARMHPATASRLVRALSNEGATVLDPFCGSGTVLVEALIAGRRAVGTDLNPLAVRLAALKTSAAWHEPSRREALVGAARSVAAFADARRERRAGATRRYPPADVALFDPHVLLELDSIRAGIADLGDDELRGALELVLSSLLVKLSRRTSDTSAGPAQRRIAAGYAARLFARKTEELSRRFADFAALLPASGARAAARVALDDASRLRTVGASTVDAVVTSPPYVATYDYVDHHALRARWLGLDAGAAARDFAALEIGARRRYANIDPAEARAAWARELTAVLRALARVTRPGARVALLVADSAVQGEALRADAVVREVAPAAGFSLLARASQRRPHFHGPTARAFAKDPRAEHAIALEKGALEPPSPPASSRAAGSR
jgi:hypothetical protein